MWSIDLKALENFWRKNLFWLRMRCKETFVVVILCLWYWSVLDRAYKICLLSFQGVIYHEKLFLLFLGCKPCLYGTRDYCLWLVWYVKNLFATFLKIFFNFLDCLFSGKAIGLPNDFLYFSQGSKGGGVIQVGSWTFYLDQFTLWSRIKKCYNARCIELTNFLWVNQSFIWCRRLFFPVRYRFLYITKMDRFYCCWRERQWLEIPRNNSLVVC